MSFSESLKAERQRLNLSQREAALALGIGRRTEQGWESGKAPHKLMQDMALAILSALTPKTKEK